MDKESSEGEKGRVIKRQERKIVLVQRGVKKSFSGLSWLNGKHTVEFFKALELLKSRAIKISMDSQGRMIDNIFIEHFGGH